MLYILNFLILDNNEIYLPNFVSVGPNLIHLYFTMFKIVKYSNKPMFNFKVGHFKLLS